jgi:hypothetical protein
MRIARNTLHRKWLWSTLGAIAVGTVLGVLDARLKALSGAGTLDLQGFTTGAQYQAAIHAWSQKAWLACAGFNLGFDYLFMPLYALCFFYSGVIVMDVFAPDGIWRRLLGMAALAPLAAAGLDMVENALQLCMLWNGPGDLLAATARSVSAAKWVGVYIGVALLAGSLFARIWPRSRPARRGWNPGA